MSTKKFKLGLVGASGRTGSMVVKVLHEFPEFMLWGGFVSSHSSQAGKLCLNASENYGKEVYYSSDIKLLLNELDILIDFSLPTNSISIVKQCAQVCKPLVLASTGQDQSTIKELQQLSKDFPLLYAPNTSLGIHVLEDALLDIKCKLGKDFQVEILELHHKHKKDSPSGTALKFAKILTEKEQELIYARSGPRESGEIGISSLRGGDATGEHTVFFLGEGERIEITHRVTNRLVFARGALKAASKLLDWKPGFYTMKDLYTSMGYLLFCFVYI